jgi:regulator of sigma E protease
VEKMSIIVALLLFSFIVFIHELGHFVFAKRGGITVEEFAIGMGPKLFGFTKNNTDWTIRLFPIGGFCKMKGEDGIVNLEGVDVSDTFFAQPVWVRIKAVFGGPLFNFILAFVFSILLMSVSTIRTTTVRMVAEGSPAQTFGIQEGDQLVSIDGQRILIPIEANMYINAAEGSPVEVKIKRTQDNGEKETLIYKITPAFVKTDESLSDEESPKYYYIGLDFTTTTNSLTNIIKYGFLETIALIKITFYSLGMLFTGQASMSALSGPVGLVSVISTGYEASLLSGIKTVIETLSFWVVLISANLGIMNLLPIPALDGGRLIFLFVEALTKKRIPQEKEGFIHFIGFALLMVLMVFVLFNDISRLIQ